VSLNGQLPHVLDPLHWACDGFVRAYQGCVRPRLGCLCLMDDISARTIVLRLVYGVIEQRVRVDLHPLASIFSPRGSGSGSVLGQRVLACVVLGPWGADQYKNRHVSVRESGVVRSISPDNRFPTLTHYGFLSQRRRATDSDR
jgi:hypothetical protein